jgi:hypothetical protein
MEPLTATALRTLQRALIDQPTTPAKVTCAFRLSAGPAMSRAATVEWNGSGTLRVIVGSATWRREIERARPVIAERMQHFLGRGVIQSFVVASEPSLESPHA